jgi:hypothetical protein
VAEAIPFNVEKFNYPHCYNIGKGMDPYTAYLTVESWGINEMF